MLPVFIVLLLWVIALALYPVSKMLCGFLQVLTHTRRPHVSC